MTLTRLRNEHIARLKQLEASGGWPNAETALREAEVGWLLATVFELKAALEYCAEDDPMAV